MKGSQFVLGFWLIVLGTTSAHALTTLTGGKAAKFKDKAGNTRDAAVIKFSNDGALGPLESPLCSGTSSVRIVSSNFTGTPITLPCGGWRATGTGYKYFDKVASAGGVQKIIYKANKLTIKMKGAQFTPIIGPVSFVEVSFSVGSSSYCGRFGQIHKNDVGNILLKGPSSACIESQPTLTPTQSTTTTPVNTSTEVPSATITLVPTISPTGVPTTTTTHTATPTVTFTPTNSFTPTIFVTATPTPTSTQFPAMLGGVTVTNNTNDFGPSGPTGIGTCRSRGISNALVANSGLNTFTTQYQAALTTDCETTLANSSQSLNSAYIVDFSLTCPAGSTYQLTVATNIVGSRTVHGDENETCSGAASTQNSMATVGAVSGSQTGGMLSGSLGIGGPGGITTNGNPDNDSPFTGNSSATITGAATGSSQPISLNFSWTNTCTSVGNAGSQGAECMIRMGLSSGLACLSNTEYGAGLPARSAANDGHFVTVTGICIIPTPTPGIPTATNTATVTHTATSTPTITLTPTATSTPTNTVFGAPTSTPTLSPTITNTPLPNTATATPTRTSTNTVAIPTATPTQTNTPGFTNFTFSTANGANALCPNPGCNQNGAGILTCMKNAPVLGGACSGTDGTSWTSPPNNGVLTFSYGAQDMATGKRVLNLVGTAVVGDKKNSIATGYACFQITQDPSFATITDSFIDCDGGTRANASYTVNSNGTSAGGTPALTIDTSADGAAPAGAALVRVILKSVATDSDSSNCSTISGAQWTAAFAHSVVLATGTVNSTVTNLRQGGSATAVMDGTPFNCAALGGDNNASLSFPLHGFDIVAPFVGTNDFANVVRLQD